MTIHTQHIVSAIHGADELLQKTEELFHGKEKKIVFIEDGFQIHAEGLPYYFQINFDEDFGWTVFLTSLNGEIEDDKETDRLYYLLEDAIDIINKKYCGDGDFE